MTAQTYGVTSLVNTYKSPIFNNRAPLASDHKYDIGQIWIYKISSTQSNYYFLAGLDGNNATWTLLGGAGNYPITPYVVGPIGQAGYQTIQAAINAAGSVGGGDVYIQRGAYTENLTLHDQVNLISVCGISQGVNAGVTITGTHIPPPSGQVLMNGICFFSTTDVLHSLVAGSAHVTFANCESAVQNGYLINLPNWTGTLEIYDCNPVTGSAPWSINDGGIFNTGGSFIVLYNTGCGSGTNVMTVSGGGFFGQAVSVGCPLTLVTGANVTSVGSQYNGIVTFSNNSIFLSYNDSFVTGTAAAFTMSSSGTIKISNAAVDSSASPVIAGSGAGVLTLLDVNYLTNSGISASLTIAYARPTGMVTPFVVGTNGNFATIQAAINAANAVGGGTIWIQPGTYTENLTLFANITICGSISQVDAGFLKIIGTHIPPTSGALGFYNIWFTSSAAIFSSAAAGTATINLFSCITEVTNGYTFDLVNWAPTGFINIFDFFAVGTNDGFINNTGGCQVTLIDVGCGNGTGHTMNITGTFIAILTQIFCPINYGGSSTVTCDNGQYTHTVTFAGTSTGKLTQCRFSTGATAALTMSSSGAVTLTDCIIDSSNNPAITGAGAGTLSYQGLSFLSNALFAGTLTLSGSSLTGTVNTSLSTGTLSVKSTTANPGNNAGFLQCSINGAVAYIPYFTNIAP